MPIDPLDLPIGANRFWPEAVQALETHGQQVQAAIAALESDSGTSVTVNGIGPDENGNITIPTGGGGGGSGLTEDPAHPGLYLINVVQTVTATPPTFTDADGTTNDRYTIPTTTGVEYRVNGTLRGAGIYTPTAGETITVVASATAGYTLTGTTSWSYTYSTGTAPVAVTPATPTADDTTNTITWTPTTGVDYVIGGTVRTPPYSVGDVDASVTVTAQAQSGYALTGTTSWTFAFTKAPASPASDYAAAVMADNPVAFYRLNEAAGVTPVDATGNTTATNTGVTLGGAVLLSPDTSAKPATTATGANHISIGQPAAFASVTNATIEFVLKMDGNTGGIVNKSNADTAKGGSVRVNATGKFTIAPAPSGTSTTINGGITVGETAHFAVTFDGTNIRFYKNGVETDVFASTGRFGGGALNVEIGRTDQYQGGRESLRSDLAGVAIYNSVLTPARILAHAQAAGLAA